MEICKDIYVIISYLQSELTVHNEGIDMNVKE